VGEVVGAVAFMDWFRIIEAIIGILAATFITWLIARISPRFRSWLSKILRPFISWPRRLWTRFILYRRKKAVLSEIAELILSYNWAKESKDARNIYATCVESLRIIAGPNPSEIVLRTPIGPFKERISQEELVPTLRYLTALLWLYTNTDSIKTMEFINALQGIAVKIKEKQY
jgi:hypothetical protein